MKIAVLAGSPKGETSVTMQYVRWLEKRYPDHQFEVVQAALRIVAFEKKGGAFEEAMETVRRADIVLWAFPLYVFSVCSQYKRFIELIDARGEADCFRGKYAASLSTSIHFFDHCAHNYVREVAEDLGQRFIGSFSPKMDDLLTAAGRAQLEAFAEELFAVAEAGLPCQRLSTPLPQRPTVKPEPVAERRTVSSKRTVVLVDYPEGGAGAMARRFAAAVDGEVEIIDLESLGMKGGCLGCLRCASNNRCAYEDADPFIGIYRTRIATADILVFAGTTVDRGLSARWKAFFDRAFFNTHQRSLSGKQFVFLVDGPLSALANQREILAAFSEWQGSSVAAMISNEATSSTELGELLDAAASRAALAAARGESALRPATFLGVGGMKIFRDDIYGGLRTVFKGDYRAYRRGGLFDFPQKNPVKLFGLWFLYWITSIPSIQRFLDSNWPRNMILSYEPVVRMAGKKAS
jgi:multimeric flavodoxin WrbA